jgi:hypothetical protein
VESEGSIFRVLTLDGGGSKGFYTLGVLYELEAIQPAIAPSNYLEGLLYKRLSRPRLFNIGMTGSQRVNR